jgi:hypothetical protein
MGALGDDESPGSTQCSDQLRLPFDLSERARQQNFNAGDIPDVIAWNAGDGAAGTPASWVNRHIPLVAAMPHGGFEQSGYGEDPPTRSRSARAWST